MKKTIWGTMVLLVLALGTQVWAQSGPEVEAAEKAARQWLDLVDQGQYRASWEASAEFFRKVVEPEKWVETLEKYHQPLGKNKSRKFVSAERRTNLPGVPDGDYVVVTYQSSFENKKSAIETVTPMLEKNGSWRVSGYYIK